MELGVLFKLFFLAVCGDFITGVTAAAKEGRLKSRTCSDGMFRTVGEVFILVGATLVAHYVPELTEITSTLIIGLLFKEGISICENLNRLGVWLPQFLINTLESGKNKVDKGEK